MAWKAGVGLAVALAVGISLAAPGGSSEPLRIASAEASHGCIPVGAIYGSSRGWYATAGVRCNSRQRKFAVSGHLTGSDHFFEFSKKCKNTRYCFDDTPIYRGDRAGEEIKIAFVGGTKKGRFSIPKYVRYKRTFRIPAPDRRPN